MIEKMCKQLQIHKEVSGEFPDSNITLVIDSIPLLALLNAQKNIFPAIYWQDKQQQQTIVCLGAINETNEIPTPQGNARYYGGIAFQQHGAQWPSFPGIRFIRPMLEFIEQTVRKNTVTMAQSIPQISKQLTLTCHFDGRSSIDDSIAFIKQLKVPRALPKSDIHVCMRRDLPNKTQWAALIDLHRNNSTLLPKVVLSRQTELICHAPVAHLALLQQWQAVDPANFHFSFQFCKDTVFIGSSPERLFKREKSTLQTEALAGTASRGQNAHEDNVLAQYLLSDEKISREHHFVTAFIVDTLHYLKARVTLSPTKVIQLNKVQHLCSPITAQLHSSTGDSALLSRLHPTPAVSGSPLLPALQFISENEPYLRGWYAGAVGYISAQKSEFSVAIRSALIQNNNIKLFAGAGIVTGSIACQEWQELENKISTVMGIISPKEKRI